MSKKAKGWLIGIAIALVGAVAVGTAVKVGRMDKTEELKSRHYEVGAISDEGKEVDLEKDSALSFRTKDFIEYNNLNISFEEDSGYTASVYFYDEDETYLSNIQIGEDEEFSWEERDSYSVPGTAEYVRVVVTLPEDEDEDGEISGFELWWKYSKNVTITYEKTE